MSFGVLRSVTSTKYICLLKIMAKQYRQFLLLLQFTFWQLVFIGITNTSTINPIQKCFSDSICPLNNFCSSPFKRCLECWKCCLFSDEYFESNTSTCKQRCRCQQGNACPWSQVCGQGEFCNLYTNKCQSCVDCLGSITPFCKYDCRNVNLSFINTQFQNKDILFKTFLGDSQPQTQFHSFKTQCSIQSNTTTNDFCPCSSILNISCPRGFQCINDTYGGQERDILFTGGVSELSLSNSLCKKCNFGQVCLDGFTSSICPQGFYCPTPANPQVPCPLGYYCPQNSTRPIECSVFSLETSTIQKGTFCENQSSTSTTLCPPGFYCPSPYELYKCPKGHFCKIQSFYPRSCPLFSTCQPQSIIPSFKGAILFISVITTAICLIAKLISVYMKNRQPHPQLLAAPSTTFTIPITMQLQQPTSFQTIKHMSWENVYITPWLPKNKGIFYGGQINAVMGVSGCGKSTLIETLRGRVITDNEKGGQVTIALLQPEVPDITYNLSRTDTYDIDKRNMKHFRNLLGFVPQDDIVFGDLTVQENLLFSYKLKGRGHKNNLSSTIYIILDKLGLLPIKDRIVGTVENRGISGGQRKRVNIGYELVGLHEIVFMDEPTSGLDAKGSYDVLQFCKMLTIDMQMCIVTVIHQPRFSTFLLLDNVILLTKYGCAFQGSPTMALAYFTLYLKSPLNPDDNPADTLIDTLVKDGKEITESWINGSQWTTLLDQNHPYFKNMFTHDFTYTSDIKEQITSFTPILNPTYYAATIIEFFNNYIGIHVDIKDVAKFLGGKKTISSIEFARRFEEVCSEALLTGKYDSFYAKVVLLGDRLVSLSAPKTHDHQDHSVFKRIRIATLVRQFVNILKRKANIKTKQQSDQKSKYEWKTVFEKEILLTCLAIKAQREHKVPLHSNPSLTTSIPTHIPEQPIVLKLYYRVLTSILHRKLLSTWRSPWILQVIITIIAAVVIGSLHGSKRTSLSKFVGDTIMACACIGVLGAVTHVRTFSIDKTNISREVKNNIPLSIIYISYNIVDLILVFLMPTIFFGIYWHLTIPLLNIGWFILVGIMIQWWTSGMSYLVSTLPINVVWSNLIVAFISLVFGAFINGNNPSVKDAVETTILKPILGLSYTRWALEALALQEYSEAFKTTPTEVLRIIQSLGFCGSFSSRNPNIIESLKFINAFMSNKGLLSVDCQSSISLAYTILFVEGLCFRVLGWLCLWIGWNVSITSLFRFHKSCCSFKGFIDILQHK